MAQAPLPNFPDSLRDIRDLVRVLNAMVRTLEIRLSTLEQPANEVAYTSSNVTASRSFDADAATVAELADVVGTLIQDLQKAGDVR